MVPDGFELMSYVTRPIPRTSLMMRLATRPGTRDQMGNSRAVMPSVDVTARSAQAWSYVRPSPITLTVRTGSSTAKVC